MLTFAIGDIHGRLDLLVDLLGQIAREAAGRPYLLICLGDLIDRGPDSSGVVHELRERQREAPDRLVCLKGNHEDMLLRAARRPGSRVLGHWLDNGGLETLASFNAGSVEEIPRDVLTWLESCPTVYEDQHRCYVHAGLNPAFPRTEQSDTDRLWIRNEFLESDHDFGRYVVHGHTPLASAWPDIRRTRINLDTAAAYGGRLSAAMFSDSEVLPVRILQAG